MMALGHNYGNGHYVMLPSLPCDGQTDVLLIRRRDRNEDDCAM